MITIQDKTLIDKSYWYMDRTTVNKSVEIEKSMLEFMKKDGEGDYSVTHNMIEELPSIYSYQLFKPEWCSKLIHEIKTCGVDMKANPDEDELRQIPEFIIRENSPQLMELMSLVVREVITPLAFSVYGHDSLSIASVQVAHYNPKGKKAGAWHHDSSSDVTVVVPLNTGDYVGGGTEFWNQGIVKPLPTGSALMFPAGSAMHRGLAVHEGDRYLLVFWLYVKQRIPDLVNNLL